MQTVHGKKYTVRQDLLQYAGGLTDLVPQGMPFDYSNRRKFALKYLTFVGVGTALPFIASGWQL